MLLQAAVFLVLMPFDDRTILGLDPWIKPFKFCVSVAVFLWTLAWFLPSLRISARARRALGWSFSLLMIAEIGCIVLQSARGVRSHFNFETGFDAAIFSVMGSLIGVNSVLLAFVVVLFFMRPAAGIRRAYLWGIRLGILVTLLGSAQGGLIVGNGQHAIGVDDGGPGLPFLNWSTEAGDLRVSHMIGLHGMQILPLFAYLLGRWKPSWTEGRRVGALFAFSALYAVLGVALLAQAMRGMAVLPGA